MTRVLPAFVVISLSVALPGCGSTSVSTLTSPTASRCEISASSHPSSFAFGGGQGLLAVNTSRDCAWTAQANVGWISLGAPREGQGEGRVTYSVAANDRAEQRHGVIVVGGARVELSQAAAPPPPPPPAPHPPSAPTPPPAPQPTPNPPPAPDPAPNPPPAPDPPGPQEGETVELSGRIDSISGMCPDLTILVSETLVVTNRKTDFVKKTKCRDMREGLLIEVKGRRQGGGTVLAEEIRQP